MNKFFTMIVRRGKKSRNEVAFTFDDGPSTRLTVQIMELFDRHSMKATFFVTGKSVQRYPEIIHSLLQSGHQIGNHTWNHISMIFKPPAVLKEEISKTDQLLESLGVPQPIQFRPPFMRIFILTYLILAKLGKRCIKASVAPKDYKATSADEIADKVLKKIKPGSIVVLHDGGKAGDKTFNALKIILPKLKKRGLKSVTVDKLIQD